MKARGPQTIHKNPYNLKNQSYVWVTILTGTQRVLNAQSNEACFVHNAQSACLWAGKVMHFLSRVGGEISK
jgi:hypothetical protein